MLQIKNVCKRYITGNLVTNALDHVSLDFRENEFVAILGPSGSGKTTLLNIVGGLDRYDDGDLIINGVSTKKYKDKDWDSYRNHKIGFIFQSYNLIPHQTVLSNVELALTISNASNKKQRAIEALEKVGLKDHINKKPNQLSGGQMQRVAIARALVNNPDIILADEPTGALDSKTSVQIMDLLKEVAEDRLVIMVTHNPELADEYASRIVTIKDGQIQSDTNPVKAEELKVIEEKTPKVKLGFPTALSLSLNNLMTKKGRTFLTAFAGAIGIIGIALILSLSNGVNDYIKKMETQMLGSYPIQLTKQAFNMSNYIETAEKVHESRLEKDNNEQKITSNNIVGDTIKATDNMIVENDLSKFKKYLENHFKEVEPSLNAVEYKYNVTPKVFRKEKDQLITVSPANLMKETTMSSYMNSIMERMQTSYSGGVSASWQQLVSSQSLRDNQYDLLHGEWPKNYNEVALIVSRDDDISDYYLYLLGILDYDEMKTIMEKAEKGEDYETKKVELDYSDFIGREYQVFAPAQLYKKSENDAYVDKSDDAKYIESLLNKSTTVKISCILKAKKEAEISSGIGYDASLTTKLIDITGSCEVIKKQMEQPSINILTGKKFEDKDKEDKNKVIKTSTNTLADNVKKTYKLLTAGPSLVFKDHDGNEYSYDQRSSATASYKDSKYAYSFYGWVDPNGNILKDNEIESIHDSTSLTLDGTFTAYYEKTALPYAEQYASMSDIDKVTLLSLMLQDSTNEAIQGVIAQAIASQMPSEEDMQKMISDYLKTEQGKTMIENFMKTEDGKQIIAQYSQSIDMDKMIKDYMAGPKGKALIASYMQSPAGQQMLSAYMKEYMKNIDMNKLLEEYMKNIDQEELMKEYMKGVDQEELIKKYMGNINQEELIKKYMGNINQEELMKKYMKDLDFSDFLNSDQISQLMATYGSNSPTSYDEVLNYLGYLTKDQPSAISLYPLDFDNKEKVEEFINAYNKQISDEKDKVTYNDIIGAVTGSITNIIDTITAVLIAFVAISLVVSSIMIAIITYISVLERTKEIGVLRALGASKNGISKIFNAETFIEGLISGIIGIVVTLLLSIPINAIVLDITDVPNICSLPPIAGIILIIISVVLTLLAGFFPSRIASKQDPVKALRSE